jgi:hypothetical protein
MSCWEKRKGLPKHKRSKQLLRSKRVRVITIFKFFKFDSRLIEYKIRKRLEIKYHLFVKVSV